MVSAAPTVKRSKVRKRPDFAARLKMRDGDRVLAAEAVNEILDQNKAEY